MTPLKDCLTCPNVRVGGLYMTSGVSEVMLCIAAYDVLDAQREAFMMVEPFNARPYVIMGRPGLSRRRPLDRCRDFCRWSKKRVSKGFPVDGLYAYVFGIGWHLLVDRG